MRRSGRESMVSTWFWSKTQESIRTIVSIVFWECENRKVIVTKGSAAERWAKEDRVSGDCKIRTGVYGIKERRNSNENKENDVICNQSVNITYDKCMRTTGNVG